MNRNPTSSSSQPLSKEEAQARIAVARARRTAASEQASETVTLSHDSMRQQLGWEIKRPGSEEAREFLGTQDHDMNDDSEVRRAKAAAREGTKARKAAIAEQHEQTVEQIDTKLDELADRPRSNAKIKKTRYARPKAGKDGELPRWARKNRRDQAHMAEGRPLKPRKKDKTPSRRMTEDPPDRQSSHYGNKHRK